MLDPESLYERLIAAGIANPNSIQGCTPEDIAHIEKVLDLQLPRAYVEFLELAGRGAGQFFWNWDIYYPKLLDLRRTANAMLDDWEDESALQLPADAVVFAMREGEMFMYFEADGESDDPPIWLYWDDPAEFEWRRKWTDNSIWGVLERELWISEDFRRNYPDSPFYRDSE